MATANPFDLLVDDDNEDITLLVAAAQQAKVEKPKKAPPPGQGAQPAAKLPSKPLPPAQASEISIGHYNRLALLGLVVFEFILCFSAQEEKGEYCVSEEGYFDSLKMVFSVASLYSTVSCILIQQFGDGVENVKPYLTD